LRLLPPFNEKARALAQSWNYLSHRSIALMQRQQGK